MANLTKNKHSEGDIRLNKKMQILYVTCCM